jgi:DNA primase
VADDRAAPIKQIKEANDIVKVIGGYIALQAAGPVYKGLCPFHNDSRPSFQVDPRWQNYRCWACGKKGDVFTFVQEFENVDFREALELLALRAGIRLRVDDAKAKSRARLLEAVRWAADLYHESLLNSPSAQTAREYLNERRLAGETIRTWLLGYAPLAGDWLAKQAGEAPVPVEILVEVGLLAPSNYGTGYYDRFRDRVMFPIRDVRGQVVGFGGRILPNSPLASRAPKYYNSCDTPLFSKSDLIYGIDRAKLAGQTAGSLAVVEGYTDVLMAHQMGVANVVATMGTALTARHVQLLRRYSPRVVLVYDADEGGSTGVDRALELFLQEDAELAIATLPEGMDPCDLLVSRGVEPLASALASAKDALDFKLDQALSTAASEGVEGSRRAVETVLGVLAMVPDSVGGPAALKRDLALTRVARRFGLREEVVRERLAEVRARQQARAAMPAGVADEVIEVKRSAKSAPADPLERELLQVLLADSSLVAVARTEVAPEMVEHPGLRRLLQGLYDLLDEGETPDIDLLRFRLADNPKLMEKALELQMVGRLHQDRADWLSQALSLVAQRREARRARQVVGEIHAAPTEEAAIEKLRLLQQR